MSYFKKFPIIKGYQLNNISYTVIDVSKRSFNPSTVFNNPDYYIEYELQEGDTPVIIADKVYDDAELAWTVMHYNNIIDYYNEWPLEQESLRKYIIKTYDDPYAIHHYESIQSGNIVQADHVAYDRKDIINFEYETNVNDLKRYIRLIRTDYIGDYVNAHNEEVGRV